MSTTDKLNKLLQTKADIKLALINKGLNPSDVFSSYADNIAAIESGGGGDNVFEIIGYDETPKEITDAIAYAKTIMDNWDASVTNRARAFYDDTQLVYFPVVDTSNIENMSHMFSGCSYLKEVPISNTSKVTDMSYMFLKCGLTLLDLSKFDTSKVTNMNYMFSYCLNLKLLNLSSFNTNNVTKMSSMFLSCDILEELDLSHFNTSNVTDMSSMFSYCEKLKSLNLNNWDTSNVTNMSSMFYSCDVLEELDISSFNFGKITGTSYLSSMFGYSPALKRLIYPENYPYNLLTSGMFSNVKVLTYLGGSIYIKDNTYTSYINFPSYATLERLLLKNLGNVSSSLTSIAFTGLNVWGTGSDEARQSLTDSLITYSYDRVANGLEAISIGLSDTTKALLTEDEIAQMTAKGYTLA